MKNPKAHKESLEVRKNIGQNLRTHRTGACFSQMKLAGESQLELSTIHRIEAAKTDTNLSTLSRIRKSLGVSWNDLLKGV